MKRTKQYKYLHISTHNSKDPVFSSIQTMYVIKCKALGNVHTNVCILYTVSYHYVALLKCKMLLLKVQSLINTAVHLMAFKFKRWLNINVQKRGDQHLSSPEWCCADVCD